MRFSTWTARRGAKLFVRAFANSTRDQAPPASNSIPLGVPGRAWWRAFTGLSCPAACSILCLSLLAGCEALGLTSLSDSEKAATGTYTLVSVNGGGLPANGGTHFKQGNTPAGCPVFVDSGGFELEENRTYEAWFNLRATCPPPPTGAGLIVNEVRQTGKWRLKGTTIELTDTDGSSFNYDRDVTLVGAEITAHVEIEWSGRLRPMTTVFRR